MSERTLFDQPAAQKKATRETRGAAYSEVAHEEEKQGERSGSGLGSRQQVVFDVIRLHGPLTNMEIADWLGWTINRVTPRVKELRGKGIVNRGPRRACRITGNMVQSWRAVSYE